MTQEQTPITFENGLKRLEQIAGEIESEAVPLERTLDLVREGRGIERALREYLEQCERELTDITAGDAPATHRVVASPMGEPATDVPMFPAI